MLWAVLSLFSAFTLATADALTKRVLREHDEYMVAWLRLLLSLPFLLPILFFIELPVPDSTFYIAFLIALPLEVLATILYIKALKASPLSLTLPFLSLTPVFLIGFSYFILSEKVSFVGGLGIVLIGGGGYILNFHRIGKGLLEPFRAITKEKGSVLMVFVALIFCFTASLGKMAITHSSPMFFAVTYYIVLTIIFTPFALALINKRRGVNTLSRIKGGSAPSLTLMVLIGFVNSMMVVSHMAAMSMAKVAYMIALKRTSLLFGLLYGYFMFKEGHIRERALGAFLMFTGFVIVVLAE